MKHLRGTVTHDVTTRICMHVRKIEHAKNGALLFIAHGIKKSKCKDKNIPIISNVKIMFSYFIFF